MANITPIAEATGRRKTAVARVKLVAAQGEKTAWKVNGRELVELFPSEATRTFMAQPLAITGTDGKFDVVAYASGGGTTGQAGAIRHALSRALSEADRENYRPLLKKEGCLTRDARMKERKKPGQPGARKRFQFSKR
ncbi:MAG: 30S ribosomal protein S9 [Kiritimatiellae bacterium]|nr:30S ribosomal protein S9 [Kiritimatiellia bacterium]